MRAAGYDAHGRQVIPLYETLHEQALDAVATIAPDVLNWHDTGCGTGTFVTRALARFEAARFLLADPSVAMLEQARERLASADRVEILPPMGSEALELGDRPAPQVITGIQAHHYFQGDGRARATTRCFELLAPRGLFVTFENVRPFTARGTTIGLERCRRHQAARGVPPTVSATLTQRFDQGFFPLSVDEHLALLRATGFGVVELLWCSYLQAGFYAIK